MIINYLFFSAKYFCLYFKYLLLIIDEVLLANTKSVEEYRSGKEKAFNALVGQIMKASKGKANPAQVNALLKQKLTPT